MIKMMKALAILLTIALFTSCGGSESNSKKSADDAYKKIIEIEEEVISPNNIVSQSKLAELLDESDKFQKTYYDDERVPTVMQKGIRSAMSLKQYNKAIEMMDILIKSYATEERAPEYLFQKAFIVAESGWLGEADKIYSQLIRNYPDHPLAEQAKLAQEMLTMTDEELIRKLENAQAQ